MKVLLDTCAVAELRHPLCRPEVRATVATIASDGLFLSTLVVADIARGVALVTDARKRRALNTWLDVLERDFADRILPVDSETAHLSGELSARVERAGFILPMVESLLAATAMRHGLYLMTHKTSAIAATGALIVDPWNDFEESPKLD